MRGHMQRWGWVWLLVVLWLGSAVGQFLAQLQEVMAEAQDHGTPFEPTEFWWAFAAATFENWQSEFLQLAVQTVLIASVWQRVGFRADWSADKDDVAELKGMLASIQTNLGIPRRK